MNSYSALYTEGDVILPRLKILDITNKFNIDLRAGVLTEKWDLSLRYYLVDGISHAGGSLVIGQSNISISDAKDSYLSFKLDHKIKNLYKPYCRGYFIFASSQTKKQRKKLVANILISN